MTRLTWGDISQRHYNAGVDRGVFYPPSGQGEAWNGLVSVEESPSESSGDARYLDGIKLGSKRSLSAFEATIEAFTYPFAFEEHLGLSGGLNSRRRQAVFNFTYRVMTDNGYKIHLVYNATASPSSKSYQFDSVDTFSWNITTKPIYIEDATPSAHLIVDAGLAYSSTVAQLEDVLYGSDESDARMPAPDEILAIFDANAILKVTDLGNDVIEIDGPDSAVTFIDATTVEVDWPSVVRLDTNTYSIYSY
jgi:hypothetical protein